jgi:hypothetical protein
MNRGRRMIHSHQLTWRARTDCVSASRTHGVGQTRVAPQARAAPRGRCNHRARRARGHRPRLAGVAAVLLLAGVAAGASAETRRVVAGPQYDKGGVWRFWFGDGYRDTWKAPAELPVLDLRTEAGGLAAEFRVGGEETVGLALKGADGRSYTFRLLRKEPRGALPPEWWGTVPARIKADYSSAEYPANLPMFSTIARSVGILFPRSRLAVMPDDPALGTFRATFADQPGSLSEYVTPGYEGITELVSSEGLWAKWREGPESRPDSREFLKARLLDLATNNFDRNRGQWRWGRVPGKRLWQPLPEDTDRCFARYDGAIMDYVRLSAPALMRYSGRYPRRIEGLTYDGDDITRWLLSDLDWPAFEEVAREVQARLTNEVIEDAVHQAPAEWYAASGAEIAAALEQRRDGLVDFARRFYLHLADRVDVRGSDRDEIATILHLDDGAVEVSLALAAADGSAGEPYYRRRFSPRETQEVRVYLLGGNDRLTTSGRRSGAITVRLLGGPGDDTLDDSGSGGSRLVDFEGRNVFRPGPGTKVDERRWVNPDPQPDGSWMEPRNYGHWTDPAAEVSWGADEQLLIGADLTRTAWSFRRYPWASEQRFSLAYSTGFAKVRAAYSGQFRLNDASLLGRVDLLASGVENLNYYGLGNETASLPKALRLTDEYTYSVFPSLRFQPSRTFEVHAGAQAKVLDPSAGSTSFVEQQKPYGSGRFGEAGVRGGFELDSRGLSRSAAEQRVTWKTGVEKPKVSGVRVAVQGFYVPGVWDVKTGFGGVDGHLAGYLGNRTVSLAARAGGGKRWGEYPWFESAAIGGTSTVRGYYANRFRGDASLYAGAELRLWLGHQLVPALPVRWGVFAFGDTGRVWLAGESSRRWHSGAGGGLMAHVIALPLTVTTALAAGAEGTRFYFQSGYAF